MERPSITIKTMGGVNYDANHLSIERRFNGEKNIFELSFLCSGSRVVLPQEEVKEIIFLINSAVWCSECDQRIDKTF